MFFTYCFYTQMRPHTLHAWSHNCVCLHRMSSSQTDRRALNITLNSIGTELTRDDRKKLYSNFGLLYPHGHNELAQAEDFDQIRAAMEKVSPRVTHEALLTRLVVPLCCSTIQDLAVF